MKVPLGDDFSVRPEDYYGADGTIVITNPNAPTGMALELSQIEDILENNRDCLLYTSTVGASLATLSWNSYLTGLSVICVGCVVVAVVLWIVIVKQGIMARRLFGKAGR